MNDRELMRAHIEALFTLDRNGRMLRINEPRGNRAPRFFLGRTVVGNEWRFRDDIDGALRAPIILAALEAAHGRAVLPEVRLGELQGVAHQLAGLNAEPGKRAFHAQRCANIRRACAAARAAHNLCGIAFAQRDGHSGCISKGLGALCHHRQIVRRGATCFLASWAVSGI